MNDSVIPFPLTSGSKGTVSGANKRAMNSYAVDLLELARFACGEPPDCCFLGYCWLGGQLRALYEHIETGAVAAFGYDARAHKLVYFCALNY
jgi:hypothetical protein